VVVCVSKCRVSSILLSANCAFYLCRYILRITKKFIPGNQSKKLSENIPFIISDDVKD